MRIFCLTSIKLCNDVPENFVMPHAYEKNAEEKMGFRNDKKRTSQNLKNNAEICENYNLTEISIGFVDSYKTLFKKKYFVMNIFREDIGMIFVPMVRGMVTCKKFSKDVLELFILFRELFAEFNCNLKITVRCIKNTSIKGFISKEEEDIYRDYANIINEHNIGERDAAFDAFPFELPNQSGDNVLRTKLSDFRTLIDLLCHPVTGCFNNVPETKRYNQKIKCLLSQRNEWKIEAPRKGEIRQQAKSYHSSKHLSWRDVDLNDFNVEDIEANVVETILFERVKLYVFPGTLHPCLTELVYSNLTSLTLIHCNLTALSIDFVNLLSPTLILLDLSNNDIRFITHSVSQLEKLQSLLLSNNHNLDETGIPWDSLPSSITKFDLRETNIAVIPEGIRKLKDLKTFFVYSNELRHISWKEISTTIKFMDIKGGGNLINEIELNDKLNLTELSIQNVGLQEINCCNLPPTLKGLFLAHNKLQYFDTQNALPNLMELSLNNNCLELINWGNLPLSLGHIYFKENKIKAIQNISHLTKLYEIVGISNNIEFISEETQKLQKLSTLELEDNNISVLPESFKELNSLKELNLACNKFDFQKHNLEEVLWKRLPKNLEQLWLSENNLLSLPCILKDIHIPHLHVDNCNINYICPFLYANPNRRNRLLNIDKNPGPSYLPFMPQKIYHPSSCNENLTAFFSPASSFANTVFTVVKKMKNKSKELKRYIITTRKKPFQDFKFYIGNEVLPVNCNCCANCGQQTDKQLIEQLMVMDYDLNLELLLPVQKRMSKQGKIDSLLKEGETQIKCYPAGKWKTNVVTRLCDSCLNEIKGKITNTLEERQKDSDQINPPNPSNVNPQQDTFLEPRQTENSEAENANIQNSNVSNMEIQSSSTMNLAHIQKPLTNENQTTASNTIPSSDPFANFLQRQYYIPQTETQQFCHYENQQRGNYQNYAPMEIDYPNYLLPPNQYQPNFNPLPYDPNIPYFSCYTQNNAFGFQSNSFASSDFTECVSQQQNLDFHENEFVSNSNVAPEVKQISNRNNDNIVDDDKEEQFWEMMRLE